MSNAQLIRSYSRLLIGMAEARVRLSSSPLFNFCYGLFRQMIVCVCLLRSRHLNSRAQIIHEADPKTLI